MQRSSFHDRAEPGRNGEHLVDHLFSVGSCEFPEKRRKKEKGERRREKEREKKVIV
jgi:hypothetical protein